MSELQNVKLTDIRRSSEIFRDVELESEKFINLVASVREDGVLNPIVLRSTVDPETGEQFFGLIEGLHRYTAAQAIGLEYIPAQILDIEETDVLRLSIVGNIHHIEPKAHQYSQALRRLFELDPLLTKAKLSNQLSKSTQWLDDRLGLLKLHSDLAVLVDEGAINLSNAYALAKLPTNEQPNYSEAAQTESPSEFVPKVLERVREIKTAQRKGMTALEEFKPIPHMQKFADIRSEMENPSVGPLLCKQEKPSTPEEGFQLAIQYALKMDPNSIAIQRQKFDERQTKLKERKDKAAMARQQTKVGGMKQRAEKLVYQAKLIQEGKTPEDVEKLLKVWDNEHKPQPLT